MSANNFQQKSELRLQSRLASMQAILCLQPQPWLFCIENTSLIALNGESLDNAEHI